MSVIELWRKEEGSKKGGGAVEVGVEVEVAAAAAAVGWGDQLA